MIKIKESNTANRLKEMMQELRITQAQLVDLCQPFCLKFKSKMDRSYLSRYLSRDYEPKQKKLAILAMALNVSESWLMGYDIPKDRQTQENTAEINEVVEKLRKLDMFDLGKISNQIDVMLEADKYKEIKSLKTA